MKKYKNAQKKQQQDDRAKIAWIIKLLISAVLIYLVLTDGGRSSISQTLGLGGAEGGVDTENILVIAFLGVYVVMTVVNGIRRFRAKSEDKGPTPSGKRLPLHR